jgi:hypothetical protein
MRIRRLLVAGFFFPDGTMKDTKLSTPSISSAGYAANQRPSFGSTSLVFDVRQLTVEGGKEGAKPKRIEV